YQRRRPRAGRAVPGRGPRVVWGLRRPTPEPLPRPGLATAGGVVVPDGGRRAGRGGGGRHVAGLAGRGGARPTDAAPQRPPAAEVGGVRRVGSTVFSGSCPQKPG